MCQAKSDSFDTSIKSSGSENYLSRQDVAVGGLGIPSPRNLEKKMDCIAAASLQYNNINTWTCIVIGGCGLSAPFLAILLFMLL